MKRPTTLSYEAIRILEEVTKDAPVNGHRLDYQPYPHGAKANMNLLLRRGLVFAHKRRSEDAYYWPTLKGLKLMGKISSWEFSVQHEAETKRKKAEDEAERKRTEYEDYRRGWEGLNCRVDSH